MQYDLLTQLLGSSTTVKLIRAENAPVIIAFLFKSFKENTRITVGEKELTASLEDFLYEVNTIENKYSKKAKDYLTDWSDSGFLRKYYEISDEPVYELTPAMENSFKWMEDLNNPDFIGTESRLKLLYSKLKEIASKSKKDVAARLNELEKQKKKIEDEIEEVKQGNIDVWDDRKIKEEYQLADETARKLLSDFRQVEQNFRDIDKEFRKKIITTKSGKGEVLSELFQQQDFLMETDQGKSFTAFWEFLLSQSMQEEFEKLVEEIMDIPVMNEVKKEGFNIEGLRINLIDAGDRTNRTTGSLLEQLRKYLEHKSFFENKRIHENISETLQIISENPDTDYDAFSLLEMEEPINIDLFLERPLFNPPQPVKFAKTSPEEGKSTGGNAILFEQFEISLLELNNNIKSALKTKSQVSFPSLVNEYKINKGIAEVVGYIEIASKNKNHICDDNTQEEILVENSKTKKQFKVKVPQIIFCK